MLVDASALIPVVAIPGRGADIDLAAALKALSDHNRMRIFVLLRGGERCVCDIEANTRLSQNLVSHHLRILRGAALITCRREGRWVYYAIDVDTLTRLHPLCTALFDPATVVQTRGRC
jgi:ArsR family transcriptional regulator